jgi:BMFP domain-containing protein YqiC
MRRDEQIAARARSLARTVLVSGLARSVTAVLEAARDQTLGTAGIVRKRGVRAIGTMTDLGDDLLSYLDPSTWLQDVYRTLGIASTNDVKELDDRIDRVESEIDHVARQRAREELLLLQQRIAELEDVLAKLRPGEREQTRDAMGALLGRLSELETRIDAMPWRKFEAGAG